MIYYKKKNDLKFCKHKYININPYMEISQNPPIRMKKIKKINIEF